MIEFGDWFLIACPRRGIFSDALYSRTEAARGGRAGRVSGSGWQRVVGRLSTLVVG